MMGLSRKKACLTCSTKKRRCDMLYPSCTRCSASGITCVYTVNTSNPIVQQLMKGTGAVEKKKRNKNVLVTPGVSYIEEKTSGTATITNNFNNPGSLTDNNKDQISYLFKIINATPPESPSFQTVTSSMFDLEMDLDNNTTSKQLSQAGPPYSSISDIITTPPDSVEDFSNSIDCQSTGTLVKLKQFKYFNLNYRLLQDAPFSEEAADLYIFRIKQYPRLFLKYLKVSFIHPSLYPKGYPPVLLTALAVCALNESMNCEEETTNKDMASKSKISSEFNRTINQLVDSVVLPMPLLSGLELLDKLALAQALLLTQCVRLYSGDIRQATQAEKLVLPLTAILDDLVGYILKPDGTAKHADSWEEWILIQSISRTCFLGAFTQGFYFYLREQPEYNLVAPFMPMSLSRNKWKASSASEWSAAAAEDSQEYDMTIAETYIIFSTITPENYDELSYEALLMLCFCLGIETIQAQCGINFSELSCADFE